MAEVKWIKVSTDMFETNRKIKQIELMPEGDTILVIWLKLLLLAGNVNDGGNIYLTPEIPYTDEMLANELRRPLTTVRMALSIFEKFGMIEIIDDILHLSSWEKYQSIEKLAEIREKNRIAQQKSRAKKKLLQGVIDTSYDGHMTSHSCHDTDIDIEKDIDKEKEKYISNICSTAEKSAIKQKPSVIDLTLNTGELYGIDEDSVKEWESLYPAVNVMQELRNMKGWLDANPTRRKTKSGIKRFINNWLSKEQNKGGVNNAKPYGASSERNSGYDEIQFGLHL